MTIRNCSVNTEGFVDNYEIAKEAYKQIVEAIISLEDSLDIYCDLPAFVDVNGERFYKHELHILGFRNRIHPA